MQSFFNEEAIHIAGWIDTAAACGLRESFKAVQGRAIIDCSDLEMLQAAAISEIARLENRLGAGNVILAGVPPQVRRVLKMLDLERWCADAPAREYRQSDPAFLIA